MKNIVIATIIAIASTTAASAYTCKNTAEIVDGETVYTYSQCGTQAPASQAVLDMMTYAANNNEVDEVEEEVVVVVAPVVEVVETVVVNTNKKERRKLTRQIKRLKNKRLTAKANNNKKRVKHLTTKIKTRKAKRNKLR